MQTHGCSVSHRECVYVCVRHGFCCTVPVAVELLPTEDFQQSQVGLSPRACSRLAADQLYIRRKAVDSP